MQALYLLALEPIAETTGDKDSYGFRPGRSVADAIRQCHTVLAWKRSAEWVLEADIEGCFDNISHDWLAENIPMDKAILKSWLKAGYVESGSLFPTEAGTPQGGSSPRCWRTWRWMDCKRFLANRSSGRGARTSTTIRR